MSPRPFPYQLGVGIDIVHHVRIAKIISNMRCGNRESSIPRFMRRFLSYHEQGTFYQRFGYSQTLLAKDEDLPDITRWLAGRWAAKEAAIKAASSWKKLSPFHVQIKPSHNGPVRATILDRPSFGVSPRDLKSILERKAAARESRPLHSIESSEVGEHGHQLRQWQKPPCTEDEAAYIAKDDSFDDFPGQTAKISISHDGDYTTAVCLVAEQPKAGDVGGEAAAREE